MSAPDRSQRPTFEVSHDAEPTDALLAGFTAFGLAGLTAVDYLVDDLDLEEVGHVTARGLPTITPFEQGTPRHHTRLFSRSDLDVTVLVSELFVPAPAADAFGRALLRWTESNVEEVAMLSGVPVGHGPDDHRTFYVATEDYRDRRLGDAGIPPMQRGFFDGVHASLLERGIASPLAVGVYVTPVHPQVPDVDAAVRLVETVEEVYDLDVDTAPLEGFATQVAAYYEGLNERVDAASDRERPEDRMYM